MTSRWKSDFTVLTDNPIWSALPFSPSYQPTAASLPLHYLDTAATCLIPKVVAQASHHYQAHFHANSHRGFYPLSAILTEQVEKIRQQVADFFRAPSANNIIFTSGTTAAIHQVAHGYIKSLLTEKSNIIVSAAEHHANFLPWQQLAQQTGAELKIIPVNDMGQMDLEVLAEQLNEDTAIITAFHTSNVLGTTNDITAIVKLARQFNAKVLVDGAQYVAHNPLDFQTLGCDFYVCSGHKLYGGNGIGVLIASDEGIAKMSPVILGGGMVERVTKDHSTWLSGTRKFEAGTLNTQALFGLSAALSYLADARINHAQNHIAKLSDYLLMRLNSIAEVSLLCPKGQASGIVAFNLNGIHSHDVASVLANDNIAVRAGHHCAQPLHQALGCNTSVRASLGLYNDKADIDALISGLERAVAIFQPSANLKPSLNQQQS
ncbi:aminotransferase class V-fold PLP-dependent enzyme [Colwellia sp. MEBiC06753]